MENTRTASKLDENQGWPLQLAQAYWKQSLPQAMDLSTGEPPTLDQMAAQRIAKTPCDFTPWSWADPLTIGGLKWTYEPTMPLTTTKMSIPDTLPMRFVRVNSLPRPGEPALETTPRYSAIVSMLSKPIGDFQANRFFSFPACIDTKFLAVLVEAIRSSSGGQCDEAAFLRCMLLSEVLVEAGKMRGLTRAASHFALDLYVKKVERGMGPYGKSAPDGHVLAVDLALFSLLLTRKKELSAHNSTFGYDTWDATTAVIPIKCEFSGARGLAPYALSFVSTLYWTQRVKYTLTATNVGGDGSTTLDLLCAPRAAQALVPGPENILFVVIDVEVHAKEELKVEIADGLQVPVWGKNAAGGPPIRVRAVVDSWLGGPSTTGRPYGRQRDAYEALGMLNAMVGTANAFDTGLNLATELSRVFHFGAELYPDGKNSAGLTCIGDTFATGGCFGRGGPMAKKLGPFTDDTVAVGAQAAWSEYYFISPAGMLCEGSGKGTFATVTSWPHLESFDCRAHSVVVTRARYDVRVARALELVAPGKSSINPRHEMSLSYWFSGNALLLGGVTYGACLAAGLDWATLNGLLVVSSDLTTSVKKFVPLYTNLRVENPVDRKRSLYIDGVSWSNYSTATKSVSTEDTASDIKSVTGFPLPAFIIFKVVQKLGLEVRRPDIIRDSYDAEENEDSIDIGVFTTPSRNWIFVPWVCDSLDYVRSKFYVYTNTPAGRSDKVVNINVWPYQWTDELSSWDPGMCAGDSVSRIRLTTNSMSGRFYAEGFLKRTTFTYVTNTAPSGDPKGEVQIDLTRPDPEPGFWYRAWTTCHGWVPDVVSDGSVRAITGTLPGYSRELGVLAGDPSLAMSPRRRLDVALSAGANTSGTVGVDGSGLDSQTLPAAQEIGSRYVARHRAELSLPQTLRRPSPSSTQRRSSPGPLRAPQGADPLEVALAQEQVDGPPQAPAGEQPQLQQQQQQPGPPC